MNRYVIQTYPGDVNFPVAVYDALKYNTLARFKRQEDAQQFIDTLVLQENSPRVLEAQQRFYIDSNDLTEVFPYLIIDAAVVFAKAKYISDAELFLRARKLQYIATGV